MVWYDIYSAQPAVIFTSSVEEDGGEDRDDARCDRRDRVVVTSVTEVSDESVVTENLKKRTQRTRRSFVGLAIVCTSREPGIW